MYIKLKAVAAVKGEFEVAFPSLETIAAVVDQSFTATT